jgi:hypothetical protein
MMKVPLIGLGGLVLASVGALGVAAATSGRVECPGKIVCPLTGELVCRDQCPEVDPDRPDCPGKIECPLTGELVCVDQCPVGAKQVDGAENVPSCCEAK